MLAFFILFIFAIRPTNAQTPSVTLTPTPTVSVSPTQSPTPTPNISLVLSEYMADASPEWVEIRNLSSSPASIADWKLGDSSSVTKTIPSTTIPGNGYYIFETSNYLNNSGDDVRLINNSGTVVDSTSYTSSSNIYSWSKNSSWCLTVQSKGSGNNSCANITPSPTPTLSPTQTPSPTSTPYPTSTTGPTQPPTSTPTRYPTFTPIPTVAPLPTDGPEPTVVFEPTATMSPDVLGDNTVNQEDIGDIVFPTPTPKSIAISGSFISPTILAAVFVGLGGVLLLIPIIVIKLRQ